MEVISPPGGLEERGVCVIERVERFGREGGREFLTDCGLARVRVGSGGTP